MKLIVVKLILQISIILQAISIVFLCSLKYVSYVLLAHARIRFHKTNIEAQIYPLSVVQFKKKLSTPTNENKVFQDTKAEDMDYSETHFQTKKKKYNIFYSELKNLT